MFKLVDVSKYYNSNGIVTIALEHINLEFKKGDIVAITGESGSGKSTLLNILCGNDSYDEGEIYFNGNETSYFDNNDLDNFRNKYVGFIYQNYNIIDSYTVLQNVMFPLLIKGVKYKEAKNKALELINKVGLKDRINHKGTKLSGGEKQRVVIARALASDPKILACDEPTGNLDSKTSKEIINLIKEVAKDKLVLIVSHNYNEVKDIATRKVTLVDGRVIEDKILNEVDEIKDEEMVLEKQQLSLKNILLFTKNNIFATPKKTLFAIMVLFAMSFVILSLFQLINLSYNNATISNTSNAIYYGPDYLVFNKKNKEAFNEDDLLKLTNLNYDFNYLEISNNINLTSNIDHFYYLNFVPKYEEIKGEIPTNSNEALIIVNNYYANNLDIYSRYIGKECNINILNLNVKIKGVAVSKYLYSNCIYIPNNYNKEILNCYLTDSVLSAYLTNYSDIKLNFRYATPSNNVKKPTLYLPYGYEDFGGLNIVYFDTYFLDISYDICYVNNYEPYILLPSDFDIDDIPIYEIGLQTDDIDKVRNELTSLNYNVYYPYLNSKNDIGTTITLIFITLISIIPVILIYLITYLIFKNIYISKFREYTIMRTIGIDKTNMNKLFLLETFSVSFSSSIITFILSLILGYSLNIDLYKQINAYIIIVFFIIMFIFSVLLAFKINRKLFAYNAAKMLKDGGNYA